MLLTLASSLTSVQIGVEKHIAILHKAATCSMDVLRSFATSTACLLKIISSAHQSHSSVCKRISLCTFDADLEIFLGSLSVSDLFDHKVLKILLKSLQERFEYSLVHKSRSQ